MPRSLLDEADLAAVRAAAAARPGPGAVVVACLLEGGAVAHAPDDPDWADRDLLVVGSRVLLQALAQAGGPAPLAVLEGGAALALAAGVAAGSALAGGVSQVFCLLDGEAVDDGASWEGALAACAARVTSGEALTHAREALTAVVLLDRPDEARARALLAAAGWRVATAPADEPLELLGALDRVHNDGGDPGAVLAVVA